MNSKTAFVIQTKAATIKDLRLYIGKGLANNVMLPTRPGFLTRTDDQVVIMATPLWATFVTYSLCRKTK